MKLPFSPSADRNEEAIGDALGVWLDAAGDVFEFGSGTGQHAVYLCQRFPHLRWQPTELKSNLESIGLQIQHARVSNILEPIECDVLDPKLFNEGLEKRLTNHPAQRSNAASNENATSGSSAVDGRYHKYRFAYSANTAHIMSIEAVERMISMAAAILQPTGFFALYGPFKYGSQHTAEGNNQFDSMLREQDASMGVRDKFELDRMAIENGLAPVDDLEMPANNRILIWQNTGQS